MPRPAVFAMGVVLVAAIGVLDWHTVGLSMIFPHVLVVLIVALFGGFFESLAITVLAVAAVIGARVLSHQPPVTMIQLVWNGSMALGAGLLTAVGISNLRQSWQRELKLSRTDPLTGALSLRSFLEIASAEIQRFKRVRKPFTLAYFDIDNFKPVNDQLGRETGDKLLREVVKIALLGLRSNDFLARMGADEFSVLLPETSADAGYSVVSRLQENLVSGMVKKGWHVTFSTGVVTFLQPPEDVDRMIRSADELMAGVKHASKNAIVHRVYNDGQLQEVTQHQTGKEN
jgi:diguanylate cyclase (GGDEF)-like protein